MTAQMLLQIGLVLLIVFLLSIPVGRYLADIVMGRKTRLDLVFDPVREVSSEPRSDGLIACGTPSKATSMVFAL